MYAFLRKRGEKLGPISFSALSDLGYIEDKNLYCPREEGNSSVAFNSGGWVGG